MDLKNSSESLVGSDYASRIPRAVWIAVAVYFVALTLLGIDRYVIYRSGADLGLFVQAIADGALGMRNQIEGGSHYIYHFSPLLSVVTPILLLARSPITLIVVQALAGALIAPAIFLLARRRMDERLASMTAVIALLYPPLVGVTFADFHENGFAPATIAWLLWAVDARRFGWAAVFAAGALAIKEDQAAALFVLGAGYAVWSAYRRDKAGAVFGVAVSATSAAVFVAFFSLVRPLAGAVHAWQPLGFYVANHAGEAQGLAAVYFRISFLIEVFAPLLFLPLRSVWVLLAVPGLLEVLTSRWSITYTMGQHYAGVWIAYVLAAFVCALASVAQKYRARAELLAKLSIIACALILVVASPTHWGHFLGPQTGHGRALNKILARIPADASVGAVDEVYAHLSLDPNARAGFTGNLAYLVVDAKYDSETWRKLYQPQLDARLRSATYDVVANDDGVTLYRLRQ